MSYTTASLVKKHAPTPRSLTEQSVSQELTLKGTTSEVISPGPIVKGSLLVLAVTQNIPSSDKVTFTTTSITLPDKPLVVGSVTVADTESLGLIYVEGVDYIVDYTSATVTRVSGGAIQAGASANVWSVPFQQFSEGDDYSVDHTSGSLRRVSSGSIEDGARVTVKLLHSTHGIDDQTYDEAVTEANQLVASTVDPNGEFGADLNLQTAATFLGSAIICRIASCAALAGGARGSDASVWLDLADSFQRDAARLLDQFKPPRQNLEAPRNA